MAIKTLPDLALRRLTLYTSPLPPPLYQRGIMKAMAPSIRELRRPTSFFMAHLEVIPTLGESDDHSTVEHHQTLGKIAHTSEEMQ